jgi:hypothetical protein
MRSLAILALCGGCAEILIASAISASNADAAARDEIHSLRLNAGLTEDAYRAELRAYDPEFYRRMRSDEMKKELPRFDEVRPLRVQLTPELRREHNAFPRGKTYWPVRHQIHRARRLAAGATEEQVLAELKTQDPRWYARLEEHWPHKR